MIWKPILRGMLDTIVNTILALGVIGGLLFLATIAKWFM